MQVRNSKNNGQPLQNKLTLIILGRSGSGKGTQTRFILSRLKKQGVSHLETGRFLRNILARFNNPTIDLAKKIMGSGKIFPDWFASYAFLKEIMEKGAAARHWVFDGAPRSLRQAELIDELCTWHRRPLPLAVYIKVSEKKAAGRLLSRGRADDNRRSVKNRMDFFAKNVAPVIARYRRQGRLLTVDGEGSVEKVRRDIDRSLSKKLKKHWPKK